MRRVHELVWAPIQPLLAGYDKALIVAHDQLGSLQFAALYDGENYLAQTMNLAMAPSARVALYGMAHQPVAAQRALVLGESSRLVHAAEEAHFVAGLFDDANVLIGTEANAVALRAACVDADVLHLACHAEFRSDNPMFSALQLVDGPFNVQDAETLQLRQGIVVLSACETGVAVYSRGDEMIGLVRAFLVAGASRAVASLWPVDDAVTLQFMAAFYHSLRDGNTPSTALRSAQLAVMKTHPHPFHWAAFTLYGGW
jgi:CHAT domain-containing protein